MKKFNDLHKRWMTDDPEYRAEYDALAGEFELPEAMVTARKCGKLSQTDVAERMETTQSAIARLEAGKTDPQVSTLRAYARATGTELVIEFRPKAEHSPAA